MDRIAIEVIDEAILAVGPDGFETRPSPGFALLDGRNLVVGHDARAVARLKPRFIDNRFWDRLDSGPMPRPFPRSMSRADVVYAHLEQLWREIGEAMGSVPPSLSVLLAVPGSYSPEQLGLALGIARACSIPVTGIVDAAVAAVSLTAAGTRVLHLDLLLHRAVWTELAVDGDLVRRRVEVLRDHGLVAVRNSWARHIAKLMVQHTRFDPLHHGDAEQSLFDQLPQWMEALVKEQRVEVTLASGDKLHSIEIAGETSGAVAAPVLRPVIEIGRALAAEGELPILAVSARAASQPGLVQELSRLPQRGVRVVPPGGAAEGALQHGDRIDSAGEDLQLVTSLPIEAAEPSTDSSPAIETRAPAPRSAVAPSHLLLAATAHAITREPLWLGSSKPDSGRGLVVAEPMPGLSRRHCCVRRVEDEVVVEDHSSYGTFVNDRRIDGRAVVVVGDRLRLGSPGVELLLVEVRAHV